LYLNVVLDVENVSFNRCKVDINLYIQLICEVSKWYILYVNDEIYMKLMSYIWDNRMSIV